MTWQDVTLYLGALVAALTTAAAFVFQYLRKSDHTVHEAVLVLKKDLDVVQAQLLSVRQGLIELEQRTGATDNRLEAKLEKLIDLFMQLRRGQ